MALVALESLEANGALGLEVARGAAAAADRPAVVLLVGGVVGDTDALGVNLRAVTSEVATTATHVTFNLWTVAAQVSAGAAGVAEQRVAVVCICGGGPVFQLHGGLGGDGRVFKGQKRRRRDGRRPNIG